MKHVEASLDKYEREIGEREWLVQQCPIDIYASSIMPRWGYPFKLMSYWEARGSVRDSADHLIIDSGYRKYGDMGKILEAAAQHDATWLVPPDITPHFYCYDEISPESRAQELARHLRKYERKDLDTGVLLPVHRPVEGCLRALANPAHTEKWSEYADGESLLDVYGGVAVGLKGIPTSERLDIMATVERETPAETHIHGLSPGTDLEMFAFLRENPHMVDSLDVSTPENAAKNNKIPDNEWHQHKVPFPSGTDVTTLRAIRATEIMLRLNHALSELCDDSEFDEITRAWAATTDDGSGPEDQPIASDDD